MSRAETEGLHPAGALQLGVLQLSNCRSKQMPEVDHWCMLVGPSESVCLAFSIALLGLKLEPQRTPPVVFFWWTTPMWTWRWNTLETTRRGREPRPTGEAVAD